MRQIDLDTKLVFSLGYPLRQSYAQYIHNYLFENEQMNYYYIRIEVKPARLGQLIGGLRCMNLAGLSVTKPDKVEVVQYLDELDESVDILGACNTVACRDGKLIGYNTDGCGFTAAIANEVNINNGCFLSFGAGGAGRACCIQLAEQGAGRIAISDPNEEAAAEVVERINRRHCGVAELVHQGDRDHLRDVLRSADLVANMSGLGMDKTRDRSPMDIRDMDNDAFYFDATYNPAETKFLLDAKAAGHRTMNGLDMMLCLSAEQFRLWTGRDVSIDTIREYAKQRIQGE